MRTSELPKQHYGHSGTRPGYTPCGRWAADVVTVFHPDRVTCSDCAHEIAADQDDSITRPKPQRAHAAECGETNHPPADADCACWCHDDSITAPQPPAVDRG